MPVRHRCNNEKLTNNHRGWSHCIICDGREHLEGCTAKLDPKKDCCAARHKSLHDSGQINGIADGSFIMWTPEHQTGVHPNDLRSK